MYSIVLLAAMTTGGDVPACHNCGGCFGGHGCSGCFGGHKHHGCSGCFGGCFGGCFKHRHHGCCGCSGAPVCCEAPVACGCCGTEAPAVEEKKEAADDEEMKEETKANAPAKLIVSIPANAKLTIDGVATKSAAARRVFVSPTLTAGKVYTYTLQAEINAETVTKKVDVRAGETSTIELNAAAVASR